MDPILARARAAHLVETALFMSIPDKLEQFVRDLPTVPKDEVPLEENCPICLIPFSEIIKEEEDTVKNEEASNAEDEEKGKEFGLTKLDGCGHIFCRRDLAEWIRTQHASCPTCRSQFIPASIMYPNPFAEDDASSDGGEYFPPSEGDEDIEVYEDVEYSEHDFWNGSDIESIPLVHLEMEEREAMMEEEAVWMVNEDTEYHDDADPEPMDPEIYTGLAELEEEYPPDLDPDVADPEFDPDPMDDGILDPDFDPEPTVNDDLADPDFDEALFEDELVESVTGPGMTGPDFDPWPMEDECGDQASEPAALVTELEAQPSYHPGREFDENVDEDSDDPDYVPTESSDDLERESDSNSVVEPNYFIEVGTVEEVESQDPRADEGSEPYSDSEQEELEVEWGLTDGESNSSASGEGEVRWTQRACQYD